MTQEPSVNIPQALPPSPHGVVPESGPPTSSNLGHPRPRVISWKKAAVILITAGFITWFHAWFFLERRTVASANEWDNLTRAPLGDDIEYWINDYWYHVRKNRTPEAPVVVLAMDTDSYQQLGLPNDAPWPRALHALMLERLAKLGARRVVMDIIFAGPSSNPEADAALADALKKIPTVLGVELNRVEQGEGGLSIARWNRVDPYEPFKENAEQIALAKLKATEDSIREIFVPRDEGDLASELPVLYEAAAHGLMNHPHRPKQRDMINFYGARASIPTYSYAQLVPDQTVFRDAFLEDATRLDRELAEIRHLFEGKVVFVGLDLPTGVGSKQKDSYTIPYEESTVFGVEIQAMAAANLIEDSWIRRWSAETERLVTLPPLFLLCAASVSLPVGWGLLLITSLLGIWSIASYQCFLHSFFLPGAAAWVTALTFFNGFALIRGILHYRARRELKSMLGPLLPPQVIKLVDTGQKEVFLSGRQTYCTAMFTDIASFTDIAESMNPADVSTMLNDYFEEAEAVVFRHGGALVSYIGDAIYALFGAPIEYADHAVAATQAGLELQKVIEAFNKRSPYPELITRIGLHAGPMVAGPLGSPRRYIYSAIGDAVNLASRIEGLNKYFGTTLMVSDTVASSLPASMSAVFIASVQAKGKTKPVELYSFFDPPLSADVSQRWRSATEAFRKRRWEEASTALAEIKPLEPRLATAVETYQDEIEGHQENPPPSDWDGAILFKKK